PLPRWRPSSAVRRLAAVEAAEPGVELVESVLASHEVEDVAVLADQVGRRQPGLPGPCDGGQAEPVGAVQAAELTAGPRVRQRPLDEGQLATGLAPVRDRLVREEAAEHLVDRPGDRGDGRDPESLV